MLLTEEKMKEAKKKLTRGLPESELKNELQAEGYSEDEINKIFAPQPYDMRSWYLLFGILICLFGFKQSSLLIIILGMALLFLYYKEHVRKQKKNEESEA